VREFPIFVPFRGGHLAAVVTVPDGEPRGLVALLTGVGAGRAHRFQVWAIAARELASRDIASVRLDWEGIGDSTGDVDEWGWGVERALYEQASEVIGVAVDATGVTRTAAVGNCSGARIAMLLAAESPGCVGAACLLLPMVPSQRQQALRRGARRGPLAAIRTNRVVRKVLIRRLKSLTGMDQTARTAIASVLGRGRLLLLYGEDDTALSSRTAEQLDRLAGSMPEGASRYELRVLPVSRMAGFESLECQRRTIDAVVEWLDGLFVGPRAVTPAR